MDNDTDIVATVDTNDTGTEVAGAAVAYVAGTVGPGMSDDDPTCLPDINRTCNTTSKCFIARRPSITNQHVPHLLNLLHAVDLVQSLSGEVKSGV